MRHWIHPVQTAVTFCRFLFQELMISLTEIEVNPTVMSMHNHEYCVFSGRLEATLTASLEKRRH